MYRQNKEGSELVSKTNQLKKTPNDGKLRNTDVLEKAELLKMLLASLGKERIDEVFDPEIAIDRAVNYYRKSSYDEKWVEGRLKSIVNRNKLTNVWKENALG